MNKKLTLLSLMTIAVLGVSAQDVINWRGVNRTGMYNETGLLKSWPENGPELLWSIDGIGEGYSSIAIADNKIYVSGMKGENNMGFISMIDMNGKLLERKPYSIEWVGNYSGSRAAVTLSEGKLYQFSGLGVLTCMEANTLNVVWQKDILRDFGAERLQFGMNEAPVVVGNMVFITTGAKQDNMVAFNKNTGSVLWKATVKGEEAAYCSPIYINDVEVPQIVNITQNSIVSVNPKDGSLLWSYPFPSRWNEQCNTPIYENGMLLCMTGNGYGSVLLKLENGGRSVSKVWASKDMSNVFSGMAKVGNYVYGCDESRNWICQDWNTGTTLLKTRLRQCVPVTADGMLYVYCDNGDVLLVKPDSGKLDIVSRFKVTKGTEQHWAHPVIYNGVLYIRHGDSLMAYKVK